MATVNFKFDLGQLVLVQQGRNTVDGIVRSASIGRGGYLGYWVEYLTEDGKVQELYVGEEDLS
jgi:hypothetical protein